MVLFDDVFAMLSIGRLGLEATRLTSDSEGISTFEWRQSSYRSRASASILDKPSIPSRPRSWWAFFPAEHGPVHQSPFTSDEMIDCLSLR